MNYTMTKPCDACPFLKGSGFTWRSLTGHASGEFACHKTCDLDDEEGVFQPKRNGKSLHCAGALIFLEVQGRPHQMMRIAERLGMYDHRQLVMDSPIARKPSDCKQREPQPGSKE